ncbi:MAG TPA: TolC family protein [Pirellulaceae bacterium]|nr:TolC family protein [Pirellulaceae bacterium]
MGGGKKTRLVPLALVAALIVGCASGPQRQSSLHASHDDNSAIVESPHVDSEVRPASATAPVLLAEPSAIANAFAPPAEVIPAPPAELGQPLALSLFDAVEMGLMQNPDLIALRFAQGVSEEMVGVAETYPFNPWVQIQVTPFQKSGDPLINDKPTNHYVLLMQQLQLAHQTKHRTEVAAAVLNSVRWNYVQAKLTNMAQTQRLYFTALYQRGIAELARSNADLNNQLLSISQKQFEGGTIAGADVAILKLDNASTRRQAALAEANYQTAVLDLKRQLGLPAAAPLVLGGRLTDWRWQELTSETPIWSTFVCVEMPVTADRAWLARTLAAGRPDVWAANADVDAARANLALARANRIPDLQIGPYYQRNNDPVTFWGIRAQMDLPVLNTGVPMVRQRLAELTQRNAVWEQLLNRATLEAQAALDRYDRALSIASDSETAVGEELPVELRKLEEQFKANEVDVVRVVTARTSFFQARRAALDTLNELAQASATLVAATGLPPEAILGPAGR